MLAEALLALSLAGAAPREIGWPTFGPPNPARWKLPRGRNEDGCAGDATEGEVLCIYWPLGDRRPVVNFFADAGPENRISLHVWVFPSFCALDQVQDAAIAALRDKLHQRHPTQGLELERREPNVLAARSPSMRMAFVRTQQELLRMELNVPKGPNADDEADFAALIASARVVEGLRQPLRRGRWLLRNLSWDMRRTHVASCGMTSDEMIALAVEELRRATREEPDDWQPWALLGEEAEARGGGQDVLAEVLGEPPLLYRAFSIVEPGSGQDELPLDREAVREAVRHYAEAVRRDPPRLRPRPDFSGYPHDRSTILAYQARAHFRLGELAAAEAAWRDALDAAARGSWGYFEAAFMLAERAYAAGDRPSARRLYDLARRGYWAYFRSDLIQLGHGPAMLSRIERRRAELWDDCRIALFFVSTKRPGCAPGADD